MHYVCLGKRPLFICSGFIPLVKPVYLICIQVTWLDTDTDDSVISSAAFGCSRQGGGSREKRTIGGVIIYPKFFMVAQVKFVNRPTVFCLFGDVAKIRTYSSLSDSQSESKLFSTPSFCSLLLLLVTTFIGVQPWFLVPNRHSDRKVCPLIT